eukprot:1159410-Pelagomonas_calceolata.AAC.3
MHRTVVHVQAQSLVFYPASCQNESNLLHRLARRLSIGFSKSGMPRYGPPLYWQRDNATGTWRSSTDYPPGAPDVTLKKGITEAKGEA